jgi:hypothetical protein
LQTFVKARRQQIGITPAEKALHQKIMTVLSTWNNGTQNNIPQQAPKKRRDAAMANVIPIRDPVNQRTVFHLKHKLIQCQG